MKKMISFILAAALSATVAMPAFAAAPTTSKAADANKWTTSGGDEAYADKMMTMVAYKGGEITVDSIQYIDQTTADATGNYKFENYIPKDLPYESDYNVVVGGEGITTPLDAGKIEKIKKETVAVTGTVGTVNNDAGNTTVTFYKDGETTVAATGSTASGSFALDVAPDATYKVEFTRPGYLKTTVTGVSVTGTLNFGGVTMTAGDVNADGTININDVVSVVNNYLTKRAEDGYSQTIDFDSNGTVNINDLLQPVNNYLKKDQTVAYADLNK